MPRHHVSVSQLCAKNYSGKHTAYLNVLEDEYNAIGVWGNSYNLPTYLLQRLNEFQLIQFGDQDCANE